MTIDPPNEAPNADELVSAYIDGQAAPDEIALVENDAALMARADTLRAVSAAMAVSQVADAGQKERHIGSALDLFDSLQRPDAHDEARTPAGGAPVASLDRRRERKRPRRLGAVTGIAAALALVFAGIVAFGFRDNNSAEVVSDASVSAIESTSQDASEALPATESLRATESLPAAEPPMAAESAASDDAGAVSATVEEEAAFEEDNSMGDAAMDDEEAQDERAASDEVAESAAANAAGLGLLLRQPDAEANFANDDFDALRAFTAQPLYVGSFNDTVDAERAFATSIHTSAVPDVSIEAAQRDAFASLDCSDELRSMTDLDGSTLVATAAIGGDAIEFHRTAAETILVVDHQTCAVQSDFTSP